MKSKTQKVHDELRPEYDFDYSKAVRGKYYRRLLEEGTNIIAWKNCEPTTVNGYV